MTLPTFLGIGAPRAGTTWLNQLLQSHPHVYTPALRDEINFFDRYYRHGLAWYEALFPAEGVGERFRAIGEISPQYLECELAAARIAATLPAAKLIVMLRHPVDRAYSQYGFFVQRRNYRKTFDTFLAELPRSLERGFYSRHLRRYLSYFDRGQILALVFEDSVADIGNTKRKLAEFLEIDAEDFPVSAGKAKVNVSSVPTCQFLCSFVAKTGRQLRKWHLEPVVDFVMRTNIPQILKKGRPLPPIDYHLKTRLAALYRREFEELEECLQIDLSCWRDEGRGRQACLPRPDAGSGAAMPCCNEDAY